MKLTKSIVYGAVTGLMIVGCATRVKPAPIEAVTGVPSYEQANSPQQNHPQMSSISRDKVVVENDASNPPPVVTNPTTKVTQTPSPATPASESDSANKASAPTNNNSAESSNKSVATPNHSISQQWVRPTNGTIVQGFTQIDKGVNYTGQVGQPIYAVNSGKVVYSGNGLKGYGNLIIIKHDNTYLSAYAHNKVNLVREGAIVKSGQIIAKMGTGDGGKALLHFEIRQNGKPIDPSTMIK